MDTNKEDVKTESTVKKVSWFKSIFTSDGEISSKRVFGAIGWLVCLGIAIYCSIKSAQAPTIVTDIVFGSTALMGLDSVTSIWGNRNK